MQQIKLVLLNRCLEGIAVKGKKYHCNNLANMLNYCYEI